MMTFITKCEQLKVAHYTLKNFLKLADSYFMIDSMMDKNTFVIQIGE